MVTPEQVIADALAGRGVSGNLLVSAAPDIATALRAAGLLPGPDDIVVSREALEVVLHDYSGDDWQQLDTDHWDRYGQAHDTLRAALSQPHPAQEQQPPSFASLSGATMRICPRCGDKRCPLANIPTATCINRPAQEQQT